MKLIIPGQPLAQMRHRHRKCGTFTQSYDPQQRQKQDVQKQLLSLIPLAMKENGLNLPLDQSLHVDLTFYMFIAKSVSKRTRMILLGSYCDKHVDIDNQIKAIFDIGNKILWIDDQYICSVSARKIYSENPRTELVISLIKEPYETTN